MADEQDARVVLAEALFNDPETRPQMEEMIAKKYPKAAPTIPGYNTRKEVEKTLAELRKEIEDAKREREAARIKQESDAEWAEVVTAGLVSDEDRTAVEEIMTKRRTANYEDAARHLRDSRKVAAPRSDSRGMQIPGVKGAGGEWFKGIVENPEGWARQAAETIMDDFANGKGNRHL